MLRKHLDDKYSPLYFLGALGAGGTAVSFFIYLTFMVDHPDTPMVTYNHLLPLLFGDNLVVAGLVGAAMLAIMAFATLHFRLLIWNLLEYRRFKRTTVHTKLMASNGEVSRMAIPLTLAMSVNVSFVLGAVFVPNLWSVVEYLFPFSLGAFALIGLYALRIFGTYLTRLMANGDFDFGDNNNLSQMLAIFAFSMLSVGFAAPGAMSHHAEISAVGIFFSLFFGSLAIVLGGMKLLLGFKSILRNGISEVASPSLWIVIPILTLLGIAFIRQSHGLQHTFDSTVANSSMFVLTSVVVSLQILFGLIGYQVMKQIGYFRDYIDGDKAHPGSYSLICPGIAAFVFGMFFISVGLVKNGLLSTLSPAYLLLLMPFAVIQFKSVVTLLKLNRKLMVAPPASTPSIA